MLVKTHLVVGLAVALYFLPHFTNPYLFFPVVLFSSLIPDLNLTLLLGKKLNNSKLAKILKNISSDNGIFFVKNNISVSVHHLSSSTKIFIQR